MRALALIGTLLLLANGAVAQTPPTGGLCPVKFRDETQEAFLIRTRPTCETRWQSKVQAGTTGTETHDHFLNRCGRACAANTPVASNDAQYVPGAAALALIATGAAFAALSSDDKPASP